MYYIFVENENLNGCGTCKCSDNGILNFEVDKNVFENYKTEPLKFIFQNNKIVENPDFTNLKQKIQKQQMKENLRKSLTIMYSYTSLNEYFHNIKKQHIKLYHFLFVK